MEERDLLIEQHMIDLRKLYPKQLLISKKQLTFLRESSESTINREKANGEGIPYKQEGTGMVMYPLREIAAWLAGTVYTDKEALKDKHIEDIWQIFPNQILFSKSQLAQLRGVSESSLNREKANETGVSHSKNGNMVRYSIQHITEWLSATIKTV